MPRLRSLTSSRWFKAALSAILLAVLIVGTNIEELGHALATAHPGWLLVALAIYVGGATLSAARWGLLARPLGFTEPMGRFLAYFFSGMFLNLFGPSTVAGDIGRALFLARGKRRILAFTSVVAHRLTGMIALVWIAALAVLLLPQYPLPRVIYWGAWLIPPLTVFAWFRGSLFAVRWLPVGHRVRVFVERDLDPYWKDHALLGVSFLLAGCFHLTQIASQIVVAWSLGLHLPWSFFLIFVPIVNLASMLPISFSGIGVREAGFWYFLPLVGADPEQAIALGLLTSAVVLAGGLVGSPFFVALRRAGDAPVGGEANATAD